VLQCVAVCQQKHVSFCRLNNIAPADTLQHTATHCNTLQHTAAHGDILIFRVLCTVGVDCRGGTSAKKLNMLQCVAVCCSVLQCAAVCFSVFQGVVVLGEAWGGH